MDHDQPPAPKRRHSGSEKRKRSLSFPVRLSPEERAEIGAAADRVGLTVGTYIRSCVLAAPTTRACRRPSVDAESAAKLLGALNRVGGNINQLAFHANVGNIPYAEEVHAAFAIHRVAVEAVLAAMGRAA